MANELNDLKNRIASFTKKYYTNLVLRGLIITPTAALGYFLSVTILENTFWFGGSIRFTILICFFLIVLFFTVYCFRKVFFWFFYKKGISGEESAKIIGKHFPVVGDQLLNVIQLSSSNQNAELLEATIKQKSEKLRKIDFKEAVDLSYNKKYLRYLLGVTSVFLMLIFIDANVITSSTKRIVLFNQKFSPKAPFDFYIKNESLRGFFNEDFTLHVSIKGKVIPSGVYLVSGRNRIKMEPVQSGEFKCEFEKLQQPIEFQIEASGFYSHSYKISIDRRPEIVQINADLLYPAYTGKTSQELVNAGNIEIPEGSVITWKLKTSQTEKAYFSLTTGTAPELMKNMTKDLFLYRKEFRNSDQYSIGLENQLSKNQDKILFSIDVIKDQHPLITMETLKDTVAFKTLSLIGNLKDDYGITSLNLVYTVNEDPTEVKKMIPIDKGRNNQNFFYHWILDSLRIMPGDKLYYFLEVWDNDQVNGSKSTRTPRQEFSLPTKEQIKQEIINHQQLTENRIDQSVQKAKDLKKSLEEAQQKLKGKQNLDWQDKKLLEDLIQKKNKVDQIVEDLKTENQLLEQKKEALTGENEKIKEKADQIQKLMNDLLDEETKKMFKELEKLLKENADMQQVQKLLDKMDRKEINLENELERTLELFKELQFEYKLDQAVSEIKNQIERQEDISKETQDLIEKKESRKVENEDHKNSGEELSNKQENLREDLEKLEKSVEEIKSLGQEIKNDTNLPSKDEFDQLRGSEKKSKESLDQGKPSESLKDQEKSISQMKQMQKELENSLNGMQMEIDAQNLESLRHIIHGLIKLSYDQEQLMKNFNNLQQTDPKYVEASQDQLKLKNDSKVLEDSILQISKKDAFMSTVATREIGELNDHIEKAVANIKERRKGIAASEMQFSMTKINNLSLLLNDHFDMMMNMMKNASAKGNGKGKGKKQGSIAKLQQQLNGEIQKLKGKQKVGKQFSESMARMAAEQERIRRALQEMQEKMKNENGKNQLGNDLPSKMQQTELDLVNKQITEQTIRRQNEILTKLLEVEKSMREQDLDPERQAKSGKDYSKKNITDFDEYVRLKQKEVELLKTLPPKFIPYYKDEVNSYFKRIN
jgi:hypothetical protein